MNPKILKTLYVSKNFMLFRESEVRGDKNTKFLYRQIIPLHHDQIL